MRTTRLVLVLALILELGLVFVQDAKRILGSKAAAALMQALG